MAAQQVLWSASKRNSNVVVVSSSHQGSNSDTVVESGNREMRNVEESNEFQPNCGKCLTKLSKGQGIACTKCKRRTHINCAFGHRGQANRSNRDEWCCELCQKEKESMEKPIDKIRCPDNCLTKGSLHLVKWKLDGSFLEYLRIGGVATEQESRCRNATGDEVES